MRRAVGTALGVVFLAWILAGCSATTRNTTIHDTLASVDAARDGFIAFDATRQAAIVTRSTSDADAKQQLAAYRTSREIVVSAFTTTYRLIATAALANDDRSVSGMVAAAAQLYMAVKAAEGL